MAHERQHRHHVSFSIYARDSDQAERICSMPSIAGLGLPRLRLRGSPGFGVMTYGTDGATFNALAIEILPIAAYADGFMPGNTRPNFSASIVSVPSFSNSSRLK
jgi:hypothetical protein